MTWRRSQLAGWRRLPGAAVVVLGATVVASCGGGEQRGAPLPPAPPAVTVAMREMAFSHPAALPRGRVLVNVRNDGTVAHRLIVAPLSEDVPPIAEDLANPERRAITPVAGIPNQAPGAVTTFAVDLPAGRYTVLCLIVDPDGKTHAEKGMASEFRVA